MLCKKKLRTVTRKARFLTESSAPIAFVRPRKRVRLSAQTTKRLSRASCRNYARAMRSKTATGRVLDHCKATARSASWKGLSTAPKRYTTFCSREQLNLYRIVDYNFQLQASYALSATANLTCNQKVLSERHNMNGKTERPPSDDLQHSWNPARVKRSILRTSTSPEIPFRTAFMRSTSAGKAR